jgi:hypothetical protein
VDPVHAVRPVGPHFFEYTDGALAVTEDYEPVRVIERRAWARRLRRGLSRLARHSGSRIASRYFEYHDRNEVHDPVLMPYAADVRARLAAATEGRVQ